ncbi:MAG TPA: VCBS repeat-containing protein, partial [Polyangiaceae bacterium]
PVATLGDGADVLAAEPTTGRLFENAAEAPCQELALALYGASELLLYQLCEEREGLVVWRDEPRVTTLAFRPATVASAAPLFADLDGNGYNDVLVATPLGTYAAYGDGTELGPLNPLNVLVEGQRLPVPPVAAGDFSGDGIADLIVPYALLVSQRLEGEISYRTAQPAYRGPWARGLVADLNADGRLDAVTASNVNPGIEFFMGLGDGRQNPFVIPTTSAAERLRTGDFDGDGVFDLAFVMPSQGPAGDDQIAIAFGNPVGAPDAPVPVAHVSGITELVELSENDHEISTDLLVVNNFGDPASDTEHHSALSLLLGSGDRRFFSPILLTTFAMDASLEQAESMAVTSGDFDGDGKVDVAAIGMNAAPLVAGLDIVFSLWLLPDFSSGMSAPRRLEWSFDPRILPVIPDPEFAPLAVRFSAADLDADGADELLIAAPIEGGSRCVLAWAGLANEGSTLGREQQIVFDASCSFEPPFEVRDLDGDGARDLVIAVGRDENLGLDVLWNDGSGRFSLERSTRIEDPNGILAFTTYERSSGGPALAYTSVQEVSWLDANADRTFSELGKLGGFQFATGITAGDIDGDGVIDLAVADAGAVRVLKAELAQQ